MNGIGSRHLGLDDTSSRAAWVTVALCYLIAVFEGFDLQAAGVAAPTLGPAFHMVPNEMGRFFSSSTFGLMIGAALGGRLSDRFGRKWVLIGAVAVFGLMSVATGLAPSYETLLAARFLTGLGIGGALPNLVALVSENIPSARKNAAIGILYAGLPSGGAVASLVSALGKAEGWQTVFFVGGVAPLIAIPLLTRALPESQQLQNVKHREDRDASGGILSALFGDGRFVSTLLLWVSFFLSLLSMYLLLNWLPTLLVSRGMSRADASLVQVSFNLLGALGSVCTGLLMDRIPLRRVVMAAFGSAAICILLLGNIPPELAVALAVAGLVGITMSATQALLYALAPGTYHTQIRGTGVGAAVAVGRLGSAVGPLLAGSLLAMGSTPQQVLQLLVPVILTAGAAVLVLVMRENRLGRSRLAANDDDVKG